MRVRVRKGVKIEADIRKRDENATLLRVVIDEMAVGPVMLLASGS